MKISYLFILSILISSTAWAEYDMPPDLRPDTDRNPMLAYQDPNPFGFGLENIQMDGDHGHMEEETKAPQGPHSPWLRFSLLGGINSVSLEDTQSTSTQDFNKIQKTFYAGADIDVTIKTYFGFNVEGFYGSGGYVNEAGSNEYSMRQLGMSGMARLQLPLQMGRFKIVPKLMGGYGYTSLGLENATATTSETIDLSVHGLMIGYGAEVHGFGDFIFTIDFARSVKTFSNYSSSTQTTPQELADASFDRLRIGAYYRLAQGFLLGAHYQTRNVQTDSTSGLPNSMQNLSQFTGSVSLEF